MNRIEKSVFAYKVNVYENVFPDFHKIIPELENPLQLTWAASSVIDNEKEGLRIRENLRNSKHGVMHGSVVESTELRMLTKKLLNYIMPALNDYVKQYGGATNWFENIEYLKYGPGEFFLEHSDASDHITRQISIVYYINDEYEGGELVFTKKNNVYKPKANSLIIFPSTPEYVHRSNEIISGTKYAASLFIR
jgi:predicted 2-oxoglutarate/Fe(II)-dependent dioxygenase YbiX